MNSKRAITRVLIANRGEIARRIIRTCNRLGIETVAVYTDVDRHAPFVNEATFAEPIGEAEAYLSQERILAAVQRSGANAVHPGYGFLSENSDFAAAVEDAGVVWIGPSSRAIRQLGSKTAAKELARAVNAPISPTLLLDHVDANQRVSSIYEFGQRYGFPLILKAAAGGGGRGMRFISETSDIATELDSAQREALKAFGSAEVFVEKCITQARHIEVQIAGDIYGNVIALGTRDCSLQRNNQKIIEEAPAINLAPGTQEQLFAAATALGKGAGYANLGTVEFLYTADGSIFFLEVNTRLQVEHPVTELVTGLDLVELQIRLASGESLADCKVTTTPIPRGHAIEARWCAEEFTDRFTTATGVVLDLSVPSSAQEAETVRVDQGVELCSEITHHYDSMIAKVIVHATNRGAVIRSLDNVLSHSRLSGVRNNRSLLIHLLRTADFVHLRHTVQGTKDLLPNPDEIHRLSEFHHIVAAVLRCCVPRSHWSQASPWLTTTAPDAEIAYNWSTTDHTGILTSTTKRNQDYLTVQLGERTTQISVIEAPNKRGSLTTATLSIDAAAPIVVSTFQDANEVWVHSPRGTSTLHQVGIGEQRTSTSGSSASEVRSTIPGRVALVCAQIGTQVAVGDTVVVLDSMKMEHPIRASAAGEISELPVRVGGIVQAGDLLFRIS